MEDEDSLETTPTWAVAAVCAALIAVALLMEHAFHLLAVFFGRRKRKTLNKALYHVQAELRSFGFMTLLLSAVKEPISKICIPERLGDTFLPCRNGFRQNSSENGVCSKGKVSLMSTSGTDQLLLLILMLAIAHVLTCLLTFGLSMAKMSRWRSWEEETQCLNYQLFNDPRRFTLAHQTSFGKRHLKLWSNYRFLTWLVCFVRQFTDSVSKADYIALRHSFIMVHFDPKYRFDFYKFLRRSLDYDFVVVAGINHWSWTYALLFIFFDARGFYSHLWIPFIPLLMLLVVGTKLEVAITKMCQESSREAVVIPGTFHVKPDNKYFWFGKQQWLLHLIHFVLFQNSFQLAFFVWAWYNFGFQSCFHRKVEDIVLCIGISAIIQFLCAYVTLPLYSLVTQMDSSLNEAIFADSVIEGLRNWRNNARKNLAVERSLPPTPRESLHSTRARNEELFGESIAEVRMYDGEASLGVPESSAQVPNFEQQSDEDVSDSEQKAAGVKSNYRTYDGEASFGLWEKQDTTEGCEKSWRER